MAKANNEPHEEYVEGIEASPAPGTIGGETTAEDGADTSGADDEVTHLSTADRDAAHRQGTKVPTDATTGSSDGLATDRTHPDDVDPHRWDGPGLENPGDDEK